MTEKEQQYFEIMLEKILHEVETVAEGHSLLDEKIDRFHKEAKADHHLAMDLIKHSHDELKKEIQSVNKHSEARDAALTSEIRAVDKRLTSEIRAVDKRLTSEIRAVDKRLTSEIRAVDKRLTSEIRAVDKRLTSEIRIVGDKVDGHEERISFLEKKAA